MEEQKSIALIAITGAILLVFIALLFVVFVISQKRKQSALKGIIDTMKAKHSTDYDEVKKEITEIKEQLRRREVS